MHELITSKLNRAALQGMHGCFGASGWPGFLHRAVGTVDLKGDLITVRVTSVSSGRHLGAVDFKKGGNCYDEWTIYKNRRESP